MIKKEQKVQKEFEENCSDMPGFNAEKDSAGNYLDLGTQAAWDGWQYSKNPPDLADLAPSSINKEPLRERITNWVDVLPDLE
jgi:hypothetical protein